MELGYGGGAIADYQHHRDNPDSWTTLEILKAAECIQALPSLGIRIVDTAARYGFGESEIVIGHFMSLSNSDGRRLEVYTKIGLASEKTMEDEYEKSIHRLGGNPHGIMLHNPDLSILWQVHHGLEWLKSKSANIGMSTEPVEQVKAWYKPDIEYRLNTIEFPLSIKDRRAEEVLKPWLVGRTDIRRIANRVLGGPGEKTIEEVEECLEFIWEQRDWIDVALIGTTKINHLKECVLIFNRLREGEKENA